MLAGSKILIFCVMVVAAAAAEPTKPTLYNGDDMLEKYDYVIVGGGTSGAVLANRLSEIEDWDVLLLESGEDPGRDDEAVKMPYSSHTLRHGPYDWQYWGECGPNACLGMENGQSYWPMGKGLGGSSLINDLSYLRGNRQDYNHWRELGNKPWRYTEVLPYFTKSENYLINEQENSTYHGKGGYLPVSNVYEERPLTSTVLKAAQQMKYKVRDLNGERQIGFMRNQINTKNGQRWTTSRAFLKPVMKRPNLHVATGAHVRKVLVDDLGRMKMVYGVEFKQNGHIFTVGTRREVILSAGTFGSPQLLLLSGIGPREHLEKMGVNVTHELNGVGQNLQSHIGFLVPYEINQLLTDTEDAVRTEENIKKWRENGKSPLSVPQSSDVVGFVNTKYSDYWEDWPEIGIRMEATSMLSKKREGAHRPMGIAPGTYDTLYADLRGKDSFSFVPILMRPKSRGYVQLKSNDPEEKPQIVANLYSDPEDVKIMVAGINRVTQLTSQKAFQEIGAKLYDKAPSSCDVHEKLSDSWWECYVRHITIPFDNPVGTCKLGMEIYKGKPTNAVVDKRLHVHGIFGLRVVDASVMPDIVTGDTHAPTVMIGERGADLIKEDWKVINIYRKPGSCGSSTPKPSIMDGPRTHADQMKKQGPDDSVQSSCSA